MTILFDFDETIAYRPGKFASTILDILFSFGYVYIDILEIRKQLQSGFPWHSPEITHKDLFQGLNWEQYMENMFCFVVNKLINNINDSRKISKLIIPKYVEVEKWQIYDDIIPALTYLKKENIKCYIASNHVPQLEQLINDLGLSEYFIKVYTSALMGYEKPNILFYDHIFKEQNLVKKDTIMIGDSYSSDIQGANRYGIKSILVRSENKWGYPYWARDFSELISGLSNIWSIGK